ncbi:MAG: retropepsin-like domain-containing protein [Kiritimatiellae bacterium]|nr:retropepsin-like domain-containing protein [Kiritimatiellia bacterium]
MTLFAFVALLAQSMMPIQGAKGDPFWAEKAPTNEVRVALNVLQERNMPMVQAKINGVDCTLLLDTGATHTTFNLDFVEKCVPGAKLEPVLLAGETNVAGAPSYFKVDSLDIGGARFENFGAMALDLSHLPAAMGVKVDGILGMNTIGRVPMALSLKNGVVVFCPGEREKAGFDKTSLRQGGDPMRIMLLAVKGGKPFWVMVDSGASMTFLLSATGWPTTGEKTEFPAVDVNGHTGLAPQRGVTGPLTVGRELAITVSPLVVDTEDPSMNRIGSDVLLEYDLFVDGLTVSFRE